MGSPVLGGIALLLMLLGANIGLGVAIVMAVRTVFKKNESLVWRVAWAALALVLFGAELMLLQITLEMARIFGYSLGVL